MSNKIKRIIQMASERRITRFLFRIRNSGYLADIGWFKSFDQQRPVDSDEQPIPWVTYSFIHFITPRLTADLSIFEFGSGNSTLFYARRVKQVTAVEHDKGWFENIRQKMPDKVNLLYESLEYDGQYCRVAGETGTLYDIIIVDGRDRVNCMKQSLRALSGTGVLVLDDSERTEYRPGIDFILAQGFRQIEFWGISPGEFYDKATSVFYRENNCMGI